MKLLCVRETFGKIVDALILQVVVRIEGLQPLKQLIAGLVLGIIHRNRRDHLRFLALSPAWALNAQREEPPLAMQIHAPTLMLNPTTVGPKAHGAALVHETRDAEHIPLNIAHVALKSDRERPPLLVTKLPVQAATRGAVEVTTADVIQRR